MAGIEIVQYATNIRLHVHVCNCRTRQKQLSNTKLLTVSGAQMLLFTYTICKTLVQCTSRMA